MHIAYFIYVSSFEYINFQETRECLKHINLAESNFTIDGNAIENASHHTS